MSYSVNIPLDIFETVEELQTFLVNELHNISESLSKVESIILPILYVEPKKPRAGMIVLADGVKWNPGSGVGFYGFNGSWRFLG